MKPAYPDRFVRAGKFYGTLSGTFKATALSLFLVVILAGCETGSIFKSSEKTSAGATGDAEPAPPEKETLQHIKRITYAAKKEGAIIKVYGAGRLKYTSYKLKGPLRLAVEIPGAVLDFEPKRIKVDDPSITHIGVVRFPKINSVRIEVELTANLNFRVTQKPEFLEIAVLASAQADNSGNPGKVSMSADEDMHRLRKKSNDLERENEKLKRELFLGKKAAEALEKENVELEAQRQKSDKTFEQTESLTETLNARIRFLDQELAELRKSPERTPASQKLLSGRNAGKVDSQRLPPPSLLPASSDSLMGMGPNAEEKKIRDTLAKWLDAWNKLDFNRYSSFYSEDFTSKEMDYRTWMRYKRSLFKRTKSIKIDMNDIKITFKGSNVKIVFAQTYKSDTHHDRGRKVLLLTNEQNSWKIVREEWGPL